ncbi:MAG: NAD(P)-binding domain-containing protein [Aggregatilineales bacterium]
MATVNLAILGLGRLGASFGLALKRYAKTPGAKHQFVITGYDETYNVTQAARKAEAIDQEARNAGAAVAKADLVILAARYGLHDALYQAFGPDLKPGAVVLDLSPLKLRAIARAAEYLPRDDQGGDSEPGSAARPDN